MNLAVLLTLALSACKGDAPYGSTTHQDAGADGGDNPGPPAPGERPRLESPGQLVPLLYGRWVNLQHTSALGAAQVTRQIPLDDPSSLAHVAFFADLNAACSRELHATLTSSDQGIVIPGCGKPGIRDGAQALCRASLARRLADETSSAALAREESAIVLDDGASPAPVWSSPPSRELHERASWAMLAVAEQRHAIASFGFALDPANCSADLDTGEQAPSESLARVAAQGLSQAHADLPVSTALADQLLRQDLLYHLQQPVNASTRVLATRGLNQSLLERIRLYTGTPYGAYDPIDGEPRNGVDVQGRYPVLYAPERDNTEDVATLLSTLKTSLFDGSHSRTGDSLRDAWFGSLRIAQPLTFGSWAMDEADLALVQFGLSTSDLEHGARFLQQKLRVSGAALVYESLPVTGQDHTLLTSLAHLDVPGPQGYVFGLTEATASLSDGDSRDYAQRGLSHALEYAERSAQHALTRGDLDEGARSALASLGQSATRRGHATLCIAPQADGARVTLTVEEVPPELSPEAARAHYALFRGEADADCAVDGLMFGRPCKSPKALDAVFNAEARTLSYAVVPSAGSVERLYLTMPPSSLDAKERETVLSVSLAPQDAADEPRCAQLPLDADLHRRLASVHTDSLGSVLPRTPRPPEGSVTYSLTEDTPVPILYERLLDVALPGAAPRSLDLGQPFSSLRRALESSVLTECDIALRGTDESGETPCESTGVEQVRAMACLAKGVHAALQGGNLGEYTLGERNQHQLRSLRLWSYQAQLDLLLALGEAIAAFACGPATGTAPASGGSLEGQLWNLAELATQQLLEDLASLRVELELAAQARWKEERDERVRLVGSIRGLHDSRLAVARLLLAVPFGLYERAPTSADALDHAMRRFPVVTHPVATAEDTRIEGLLRTSGLHPLLPDLTIHNQRFEGGSYASHLALGSLATRLRERLVELDAGQYAASPAQASSFLSWLGVTQRDLEHASARLVQLSEARGSALLARPNTQPVQALGLEASYPAPSVAHLAALTEGRAHLAKDAWPPSFAARGPYHALAFLVDAMSQRLRSEDTWDPPTRMAREAAHALLRNHAAPPLYTLQRDTEQGSTTQLRVRVTMDASTSPETARQRYELWWTDAGLACALTAHVNGQPCVPEDFRFDASQATLTTSASSIFGQQTVELHNLSFPTPSTWDPTLSPEATRGRVYLTEQREDGRHAVLGASLETRREHASVLHQMPAAAELNTGILELLAYQPNGEGCGACRPRSTCERTTCDLGLCVREALDGLSCASEGICHAGLCNKPGCGDGARSNGDDGVPYEACDDGNLENDDGCSALCVVETRELDPISEEGWPAGPSPAVGVDGLGRAMLVYTADDLDETQMRIRGLRFDAFANQLGSEFTLESGVPRGYQAQPNVAGLRDGGFVALYATPDAGGQAGLVFRLIDGSGVAGAAHAVDESGSGQQGGRVVAVGDGFAVVWLEPGAGAQENRVHMRRFDVQGEAFGPSFEVSPAGFGVDQAEPAVVSSLGQVLVVWSESQSLGALRLGLRGRRISGLGTPVDATFTLTTADASEPTLSVLGTDDYVVAWTQHSAETNRDIWQRTVRRFGSAVDLGTPAVAVLETPQAEWRPVIAGGLGTDVLIAHQLGAPFSQGAVYAPGFDDPSLEHARTALSASDEADVSVVRTSQGLWLVWSERLAQRRALYAVVLPLEGLSVMGE